ncbi:MOSC N-terminal beta barrel domain-containing protein [Hymenobacter humi]|uniref:MOSC N-terminal beta barrel domain-containing protein n=1 Tax=Hymenobacter humi TaxID=1411620 RepID=A0ABW2U9Z4_9BACT
MSDALTLTGLYLYPVKSLGGYAVPDAEVTARGLRHDRRWLLVDERNRFMTQRQQPEPGLADRGAGLQRLPHQPPPAARFAASVCAV